MRKYIETFDVKVCLMSKKYETLSKNFCTGTTYPEKGIGEYLTDGQYKEDFESGDGVTYIVVRTYIDSSDKSIEEIIAYFTLSMSALPYYYRDITEDEQIEYTDILCGISAVKINMFGVSVNYQGVFYKDADGDKPVAAWIFDMIISMIDESSTSYMGVKAIYLHSLDSAKKFYEKNLFKPAKEYFHPFDCADNDLDVYYTFIRNVTGLNGK